MGDTHTHTHTHDHDHAHDHAAPRDPSLGMDSSSMAEALKYAPGIEHITIGA